MPLNEFLNIKLDVKFEDKYNALATTEILEHPEKYPLIYPFISDMKEYCEDIEAENCFDCSLFQLDDPDTNAGYGETMELYSAFLRAFATEMQNDPIECEYASLGLDYLWRPNTHGILDPYVNYIARYEVGVDKNCTYISSRMKYPDAPEYEYLASASTEIYSRTYNADNIKTMNILGKTVAELFRNDMLFANRFDSDGLSENCQTLKSGSVGYPFDMYTFIFGKNTIRLFSTERGFDALSIVRFPIFDSLTDEQRKSGVVRIIENIGDKTAE